MNQYNHCVVEHVETFHHMNDIADDLEGEAAEKNPAIAGRKMKKTNLRDDRVIGMVL